MKQSTISRIESNRGLPSPDKFEPLASALGVPVSHFFGSTGEKVERPNKETNRFSLIRPADHFLSTCGSFGRMASVDRSETSVSSGNVVEDRKIIEAYRKLEAGSPRKMAVDILLFAKGADDEDIR
jgi:transcriptional regulator with XRE-family HTH domain